MSAGDGAGIIFGLDPLWLSSGILVVTYGLLFFETLHRTVVALAGAGLVVISGLVDQDQAIAGVDFNTIALLTGMMMIVAVLRTTGLFEYIAIWSAKKVGGDARGVLVVLALVTAVFSAFLDNLTTVLLMVPVALVIAEKLEVTPYPYMLSQILASNIGGTATLIGDPPNILIGSATGLTFVDFLDHMGPVVLIVLAVSIAAFTLIWGRQLKGDPAHRARIMHFREAQAITDGRRLAKSLVVLAVVIAGFIVGEHYGVRPGTTAMTGAAVLLAVIGHHDSMPGQARRLHETFSEVEWETLFFFIGIFVVVAGVQHAGVLKLLGAELLRLSGGDAKTATFATLWLAAVVSAIIDNIPFVATMIPLVESMEAAIGGKQALEPVWWALALGACFGGNGSLIGAAANVMVAGLGERAGYPITFKRFLAVGLPMMLVSMLIASVYMYFRHFA
jgi:Na+/H+ antiporter NhaD/arsenite permease-like protein